MLCLCWHLCGWEIPLWPLTPNWLPHLSFAGGTTSTNPIMEFMPGEHFRPNLLPCFPVQCVSFKAKLNHFTGSCRCESAARVLPDRCINSANGPIIQCHQRYWPRSRRTVKLTSIRVNSFFMAPLHKWTWHCWTLALADYRERQNRHTCC